MDQEFPHRLNADRTIEAHAALNIIEERIRILRGYEQWCRRQPNRAHWTPLRQEYRDECRALLRLRRQWRTVARPVIERSDPITLADALYPLPTATLDDWAPGELAEAFGR